MYTKVGCGFYFAFKRDYNRFAFQLTRSFVNTSIMQIDGLPWFDKQATMEDNHTLSGAPDGSVYLYK